MVDALVSGTSVRDDVQVRVLSWALNQEAGFKTENQASFFLEGGGQGGGEGEGVDSLFRYNFRCHPGCCVVIRALLSALYTYFIRTFGESEPYSCKFEALSPIAHTLQVAHTGELPENHRESEPISHESWALSPGNEIEQCFYGYSACILCPSYQGKVNQFATNSWHFHLWPIHYKGNYQKTTGKVNQISTNPWHFPPELRRQVSLLEYTTSSSLRRLKIKH